MKSFLKSFPKSGDLIRLHGVNTVLVLEEIPPGHSELNGNLGPGEKAFRCLKINNNRKYIVYLERFFSDYEILVSV